MIEIHKIGRSSKHDAFLAERSLSRLDCRNAVVLPDMTGLSFQFWGEHCTECAAPDCHQTCDMFERGPAGKCRRFLDGLVANKSDKKAFPWFIESVFKPSGRLLCVANTYCCSPRSYKIAAGLFLRAGRLGYLLQSLLRFLPSRSQWYVTDRMRGLGNRLPRLLNRLAAGGEGAAPPGRFLVVIGNPQAGSVRIEVEISGFGDSQRGRSLRRTFMAIQGWNSFAVPVAEIAENIDMAALFRISIVPLVERPTFLQVLYAGFVSGGPAEPVTEERKIKLLVTDLDNTLWDGIMIESQDEALRVRPGVQEVLEELDRRGILLSIASKNNHKDAEAQLRRTGLWDMFLYPQINWEPKSVNIERIVARLNIGIDSVAFIDDSVFEREQVKTALPKVRTFDAVEFGQLTAKPELNVPITDESRKRRALYMDDQQRKTAFDESKLDYTAFLASCDMRLKLSALGRDNYERVFELVQRTNQLNFSGNRYGRVDLDRIATDPGLVTAVASCEDRFGDYGIIGFALISALEGSLEVRDLMLSCRVQGRKVEHALFSHLLTVARQAGLKQLICRYRRTQRNEPAGRVLADLGFRLKEQTGPADGAQEFVLEVNAGAVLDSPPVRVTDEIDVSKRL